MGELAGQADRGVDPEASQRARFFFLRHIAPWCQQALTDLAARAERRFYRGIAAMVSAFLESERRAYAA
jgi:TorA maturation chaperone TorD